jgi:putative ABC transport system ATP-binding protein
VEELHRHQRRVLQEITTAPVVVDDVRKIYPASDVPVVALDGVSLEVQRGEMVALTGPSGCGKSTLLNLIGCLDLPTSGRVVLDGRATASLDDDALTLLRRDRVGTVFQFFNLLPTLDLAANVGLPLVLQRVAPAEIAARIAAVLADVGLSEKAQAFPAQASGGQLQRAAIARAIVHRPAVLLADEPTGNLDSQNGETVLRLLRGLADAGQTIVLATHSAAAAAVCDRTIRMHDGRIAR